MILVTYVPDLIIFGVLVSYSSFVFLNVHVFDLKWKGHELDMHINKAMIFMFHEVKETLLESLEE